MVSPLDYEQLHSLTIRKKFGERLRAERRRLGFTQDKFAELGGVKRVSQHLYESGRRVPSSSYLQLITKHGVDLPYLIEYSEQEAGSSSINLTVDALANIYHQIEKYSANRPDGPMGLSERVQLFQICCIALSGTFLDANEMDQKIFQLLDIGSSHGADIKKPQSPK